MPLSQSVPGGSSSDPIPSNDCYGSLTQAADTAITRLVPPRAGARAMIASWCYRSAGTAHVLTFMPVVMEKKVTVEAAVGATTVTVDSAPTSYDGSIWAAGDWVSIEHDDGTWGEYLISGVSGLVATINALTAGVEVGSRFCFHGAATDHTSRRVTTVASTEHVFTGDGVRGVACTAAKDNEPILVHSNNATAAGILRWLGFAYGNV